MQADLNSFTFLLFDDDLTNKNSMQTLSASKRIIVMKLNAHTPGRGRESVIGPLMPFHSQPESLRKEKKNPFFFSFISQTQTPAYTPTLHTPTLLTFTCTQVLWFLARLTRPRDSGVTTRPTTRLTLIPTRATQCIGGV